ncbi:MAG: helix-turn-helix transcriptional regulator [Synergistaceae bacterium]|nr:helix-turn-helix transcriptional regulator [Synergistaceae bacterium]
MQTERVQIGKRIRSFRKSKGMTQIELAELTGLSRNSIINYERGYRTPRADALEVLASLMGISVTAFFDVR